MELEKMYIQYAACGLFITGTERGNIIMTMILYEFTKNVALWQFRQIAIVIVSIFPNTKLCCGQM